MKRSIFTLLPRAIMLGTALLFLASGCNRGAGSGENTLALTPIVNNPDHPNTIFLRITEVQEADTAYLYTVRGLFEGDTLGFVVSLDRNIGPGINEDGSVREDGFQRGSVKFLRSGAESDRFVSVLATLWEVSDMRDANFATSAVVPLTFSSNKAAVDQTTSSTNNFKLFFEPDADKPGELFFTVDLYRRGIELQEKDAEYREAIVRALAGIDNVDSPER